MHIYVYIQNVPNHRFFNIFLKGQGSTFSNLQIFSSTDMMWSSTNQFEETKNENIFDAENCVVRTETNYLAFFETKIGKSGRASTLRQVWHFLQVHSPEYLARINSPPGIRWRKKHCESGPVFDLTKNYNFVSRESRSRDEHLNIWCEQRWFSGTKFQSYSPNVRLLC